MTLTRFSGAYDEIFKNCVIWWTGRDQTITGFPIIPAGVTVTPAGTFANDLNLGTNTIVKTFDGSTNSISLTDSTAWNIFEADFTITGWVKATTLPSATSRTICGQQIITGSNTDYWYLDIFNASQLGITLKGKVSSAFTFSYYAYYAFNADTWYHFTIQRSGTSCIVMIDAVSQSVGIEQAWTGTTDIAQPLFIGRSTAFMYGNIKDFMIFTRALSQAEIMLVMRKTNPVSGQDNFYPTLSGIRGVE